MNSRQLGRRMSGQPAHRLSTTKIAVSLLATAALCLGPSVTAFADDGADNAAPVAAASQPAAQSSEAPPPPPPEPPEAPPAPAENPAPPPADPAPPAPSAPDPAAGDPAGNTPGDSAGDPAEDSAADARDESGEESSSVTDAATEASAMTLGVQSDKSKTKDEKKEDNKGHQGVTICHATSSDENPYVQQTVDVDSIFRNNGHSEHTKANGTRADVIPAFWYVKNGNKHELGTPENGAYYPGKGLNDTGLYMLQNNCNTPPKPPPPPPPHPTKPAISVDAGPCIPVEGGESSADITATNLKPGAKYLIEVKHSGDSVYSEWVTAAKNGTATVTVGLSAVGKYVASVTPKKGHSALQKFWIEKCPPVVPNPALDVAVMQCVAGDSSNALQALFRASGLLPGEEATLDVTGPGGFAWSGMVTGSDAGTAEATVVLGADGSYTAVLSVAGEAIAPALYVVDEEVVQVTRPSPASATIEFTAAKACPTVKTVAGPPPAQVDRPDAVLAATGSTGQQALIWAGVIAMIVAAGLMLEPVIARRKRGSRN